MVPPMPETTLDLMAERSRSLYDQPCLELLDGDRVMVLTGLEVCAQVRAVARGLVGAGITPGARVGLMSRARPEALLAGLGLWAASAVVVPLDPDLAPEQLRQVLLDARVVAVVVEQAEDRARIDHATQGEARAPAVLILQDGALDRLAHEGAAVPPLAADERRWLLQPADLALLAYAPDAHGRMRGARLTHHALAAQARALRLALQRELPAAEPDQDPARLLVTGSAADLHTWAALLAGLSAATSLAFCVEDGAALLVAAKRFRPTVLVAPPSLLARVAGPDGPGGGRRARRARAARTEPAGWIGRTRQHLAQRLRRAPLRRRAGGHLRTVLLTGRATDQAVPRLLRGAGIDALQGYGCPEVGGLVTVDRPGASVAGSGRPLPGTVIRIDPEGRIEVAAPGLLTGYEGFVPRSGAWARTRDHGWLDERGRLHVDPAAQRAS
jgi:long-chain acyl-CoA synthetase